MIRADPPAAREHHCGRTERSRSSPTRGSAGESTTRRFPGRAAGQPEDGRPGSDVTGVRRSDADCPRRLVAAIGELSDGPAAGGSEGDCDVLCNTQPTRVSRVGALASIDRPSVHPAIVAGRAPSTSRTQAHRLAVRPVRRSRTSRRFPSAVTSAWVPACWRERRPAGPLRCPAQVRASSPVRPVDGMTPAEVLGLVGSPCALCDRAGCAGGMGYWTGRMDR